MEAMDRILNLDNFDEEILSVSVGTFRMIKSFYILFVFQNLGASNFRNLRFSRMFEYAAILDPRFPTQLLKYFEYVELIYKLPGKCSNAWA